MVRSVRMRGGSPGHPDAGPATDTPTVVHDDGRAGFAPPFTVSATPPVGAAHS